MNHLLRSLHWLLLLGALNGQAQTNGLRVLTYNIHIGRGLDGRYDLGRIARVIRDADVDLVALQEVDRGTRRSQGADQPAELARLLPGYTPFFASAMSFDGGAYGVCVLSRLPIKGTQAVALPGAAGCEPRAAAVLAVEFRGESLTFVATHLENQNNDTRLIQVKALEAAVPLATGAWAVLAGDFNTAPYRAALAPLTNRWRVTWSGEAPPSFPANQPDRAIDHVWVHPAARADGVRCEVLAEPVASDHRPVRAVWPARRTEDG